MEELKELEKLLEELKKGNKILESENIRFISS